MERLEKTGNIRSDFISYCELIASQQESYSLNNSEEFSQNRSVESYGACRNDLLDSILFYILREDLPRQEEEDANLAEENSDEEDEKNYDSEESVESDEYGKNKKVASTTFTTKHETTTKELKSFQLAFLTDKTKEKVKNEIYLSTPKYRLEFIDVYCLSRAIELTKFVLVDVKFVGCRLSLQSIGCLCDALKNIKNLKSVSIEMNNFSENNENMDAKQIQHFIDEQGQQNSITISSTPLTSFLQINSKFLSLRSCGLDDHHMKDIAAGLASNCETQELNLFGNNFSTQGMEYLANALRSNIKLVNLNLGLNSQITNEALETFVAGFKPMILETEQQYNELRQNLYTSLFGFEMVSNSEIPYSNLFDPKNKPKVDPKKGKPQLDMYEPWESKCEKIIEKVELPPPDDPKKKKVEIQEIVKFKIPGNMALQSINFACNRNIDDNGLEYLLQVSSDCKLNRLSFAQCNVSTAKLIEVANYLTKK